MFERKSLSNATIAVKPNGQRRLAKGDGDLDRVDCRVSRELLRGNLGTLLQRRRHVVRVRHVPEYTHAADERNSFLSLFFHAMRKRAERLTEKFTSLVGLTTQEKAR